jgi:hypothetical protein
MTTRCVCSFLAALLSACASGHDRGPALQETSGGKAAPVTDEAKASHVRMLAELKKIIERTDGENELLGSIKIKRLKEALAKLPPTAQPAVRFQVLVELGDRLVYYGDERDGLAVMQQAFDLGPEGIPPDAYQESKVRHAAAWMRLAETENCCANNNKDSCLLPFQGGAIHTKPEGSTNAMRLLNEVLAATEKSSEVHLKAQWMLNMAAWTLGKYPDAVPEAERIPLDFFKGKKDFPRFTNVAKEVGIHYLNLAGGSIADDFDNDDDIDLLVSGYGSDGQLEFFVNEGGRFVRRTEEVGLAGIVGGLNIIQGDYDNDGFVDVYVPRGAWLGAIGRQPDSLLHNDGGKSFTDRAYEAGIAGVDYPNVTAVFSDYDNDGDLDIYVGNEQDANVKAPCQLFRNQGDGTFTDVAEAAGVTNGGYTRGVIAGDYDGDRWPDFWVSNLNEPNRLYRNQGDGTFEDVAPKLGITGPKKAYAAWFFDFDNDGALDIHVNTFGAKPSDIAAKALGLSFEASLPALYRGDGKGGFRDIGREAGLNEPYSAMGANCGDYDNDGFIDYYAGTGRPEARDLVPDKAYLNVGGKKYEDITLVSGLGNLQKGHGRSFADFDSDGDLDVFAQMGGAFRSDLFYDALYENPGFPGTHWLAVELEGRQSNRCAMGARLRADIVENGAKRSVYRWVGSGGSFGANPLRQHLGLGKCEKLERLEVFWPTTGKTQAFTGLPLDRLVYIGEGSDEPVVKAPKPVELGGAKH